MSTWAALAVKGTAVAATTAAGADAARAIAPGALAGFAAGALLTGMCFLVVVAPKTTRARFAARRGPRPARVRRIRVRPDYYALPGDTHSPAVPIEESLPVPETEPLEPDPETAMSVVMVMPAPVATMADATTQLADEADATEIPELLPLSFADPALEVYAPAWQDYDGHAGADPYAPSELDPVGYAQGTAEDFGPDSGFDTDPDDDIVLPGEDEDDDEGGRRFFGRGRLTRKDSAERRSDPKRQPPRHAAPPSRFRARMSSKLAPVPARS